MAGTRAPLAFSATLFRPGLATALALIVHAPVWGQQSGAFVDLSFVRSRPPPGVDGRPGNYFGAGLTLRGEARSLVQGWARIRGGVDLAAESPDYGELAGMGALQLPVGSRLNLGLNFSGFLLGYTGPSEYRAGAAAVQPSVTFAVGHTGVQIQGGRWLGRTSVRTTEGGGPFGPAISGARTVADLGMWQGGADVWVGAGVLTAGLGAEVLSTDSAEYRGGRAWAMVRPLAGLELTGMVVGRRSGSRRESGFVAMASYEARPGVTVEGVLAQTLTDVLLGSPRALAAVLTLRLRVGSPAGSRAAASAGAPAAEPAAVALVLGEGRDRSLRRVRFTLEAQAGSVSLLGDFTDWEPVPMARSSSGVWHLERDLAPGVYRYGFLADGRWYVPEGVSGLTDDGFGQKNLVLVVPEG
jgi:hypothetical protein